MLLAVVPILFAVSCKNKPESQDNFAAVDTLVKQSSFQKQIDGKNVEGLTLTYRQNGVKNPIIVFLISGKGGSYKAHKLS